MLVNLQGQILDLPGPEAQLLLRMGYAHHLETATVSPSDGSRMPRGPRRATAAKPRKSRAVSKPPATTLESLPTTD